MFCESEDVVLKNPARALFRNRFLWDWFTRDPIHIFCQADTPGPGKSIYHKDDTKNNAHKDHSIILGIVFVFVSLNNSVL